MSADVIIALLLGLGAGFALCSLVHYMGRRHLSETFRALSSEALAANNSQFMDLAKSILSREQEQARNELDKRTTTMAQALKPIEENIKRLDQQNRELEKTRIEAYKGLSIHLTGLIDTQKQLHHETNQLKLALRKPHGRGSWGDEQLRRVLEMAHMVEHCDFIAQVSETDDGGRILRPDYVVRLPGGRQIIIDSKAPIDALLDEAEGEGEATNQNNIRLAKNLRDHIKKLSEKAYWEQFENTPDFVIMFVPGEHIIATAFQTDASLFNYGIERRVFVSSPLSLIAVLQTISHSWRQEKIADHARHISQLGKDLHDAMGILSEHLQKVGNSLKASVGHYNSAVGSFETNALSRARKLKETHNIVSNRDIEILEPIEILPRGLSQQEDTEMLSNISVIPSKTGTDK